MKLSLTIILFSLIAVSCSKSNDIGDSAKELGNDAKRATEGAVRDVKDEACEMVNGKMECAADKVKHSIQDGADAVEDAVD